MVQELIKEGFTSITFPTVRRVFPSLIAKQLVSIQPMTQPSGLIFYMDYTYGDNDKKIALMITESVNIRDTLIELVKNYDGVLVRKIVEEKFVEHLMLLDKLLILK